MDVKVLFRKSHAEENELEIASKYFDVVESRSLCRDCLVIPRYSALPYYVELENDLKYNNCKLINTFREHDFIAGFHYYPIVQDITFRSWRAEEYFAYSNYNGPVVIKGETNSKKAYWNTMMFAADREDAIEVASRLRKDEFISQQQLIVREYVPLKTFEIGINGMRFTNEWRFFFMGNKILSYGYYWVGAENAEEINNKGPTIDAINFAIKAANKIEEYVKFFVLDIAETEDGKWILVEVNDAQMSGLSMNDPDILYKNLQYYINEKK